jgi:hypothetical protein
MLTHPVYAGRMPFNRMDARSRRRSEAEQVFAKVPAIIEPHVFGEVPTRDCSPRGERCKGRSIRMDKLDALVTTHRAD